PVDSPEQDAGVKKSIEDIESQIRGGAPLASVARQYSRNPSAAAGGDIGWVYDGQLAPELNDALSKMGENQLSHPIRPRGGYSLLALKARREPLGTDVNVVETPTPTGPPGPLPLVRLLLPMGGATKEQLQNAMTVAIQIKGAVQSCDQMKKISED